MHLNSETYELPCGFLVTDGEAKHLYTHVMIREMTGVEEDLLTDEKKIITGQAFHDILAACCTLINPESGKKLQLTPERVLDMALGDSMFSLVKLREVSHSSMFKFALKCRNKFCQKTNNFEVDLAQLPVKKMSDPLIRSHIFSFPDDEAKDGETAITFKIADGHTEQKMKYLLDQHPNEKMTVNLAARTVSINTGKDKEPRFFPYLKRLPKRIRLAYFRAAEKVEGGIDLSMDKQTINTCKYCDTKFTEDIPLDDPNFFYPESI